MNDSFGLRGVIMPAVFGGFLTATTLIVGINFKIFNLVFKDSVKKYWWLFFLSALVPLMLFLTISSYLLTGEIKTEGFFPGAEDTFYFGPLDN